MSIHKSLVPQSKLRRHRNVLSRAERLDKLLEEERRKDEDSVFGLPKVRNIMIRAKKKVKKAVEGEAVEGIEGAAPAEGEAAAPAATEKKEEKKDKKDKK